LKQKFCTYCGSELSEKADVCMNCGRYVKKSNNQTVINNQNQKHGLSGCVIALIVVGIVFLFFSAILIIGLKFAYNFVESKKYEEIIDEAYIFGTIGDTLTTGDFRFTLKEANVYDTLGEDIYINTPSEGKEYLVFFFEVENISDESSYLNSLYFKGYQDDYLVDQTFILQDFEGYKYLEGNIDKNEKILGYLVYEVDEGFQTFDLDYDEMFTSNPKIRFEIKCPSCINNVV